MCSPGMSDRGCRRTSPVVAGCMKLPGCGRHKLRLGLVAEGGGGGQGQARLDDGVDAVTGYNQTRRRAWKGEDKAPWFTAFEVVRLQWLARPLRFVAVQGG
jgi:hypothetical protein